MWLFRRLIERGLALRAFLAAAWIAVGVMCIVMALSSCGFAPVYAPQVAGVDVSAHNASVGIANIPNRNGQYLRNALIDRVNRQGRPATPRYTLSVGNLSESLTSLGVRKDASATRGQIEISAVVRLYDNVKGDYVLIRRLSAAGGHNILNNQYATLVSEQYVREHVLDELADHIQNELNLYFLRADSQ